MSNAVYGKTMENKRNRINVKLVSSKNDYLKWACKPRYMSHKIFANDLVVMRKMKVTLTLNKPAYVGMCILQSSKVLSYEFHYNYVKHKYGNNSRLLFEDTDSTWNETHEIKTDDAYKDFSSDKETFDFNNYSTSQNIIIKIN